MEGLVGAVDGAASALFGGVASPEISPGGALVLPVGDSAPATAASEPTALSNNRTVLKQKLHRLCQEHSRVRHMFFDGGQTPVPTRLATQCSKTGLSVIVIMRLGNVPTLLWAGSERAFFLAQFWGKMGTWSAFLGVEVSGVNEAAAAAVPAAAKPEFKEGVVYPPDYIDALGGLRANTTRYSDPRPTIAEISEKVRGVFDTAWN